ncbi:hypothetical protein EDC56_3615 [Sinobacterium caligoides]|uniref:Porin n=1 Tax=Sinobacterium caligoides TaxID=933926 RepID=A0A3N2DDU4_9GAMM|nr:DcaP family trimeric outer membrane transporter [Sinobacterium caligoides]ROR97946.1 hypothetical protein EDC56_3615 [Sinobacterium caligoides]
MLRKIAPIALAVFAANGALAQDTTQSSQAQTLSELQAQVDSLREEMRNNESSSSEKSGLSSDVAGSKVNFGGFVRLTAGQTSGDDATAGGPNSLNPFRMSTTGSKRGDQFDAGAGESRLNMEILTPSRFGTVRTYVEGDFADTFRLRHAYFAVGHWTVGQTDSVFNDAAPGVNTIDFQGPAGTFSQRRPLVAYRNSFGDNWSYAVSAEQSKTSWGTDRDLKTVNVDRPDLVASLKNEGDWGHIAVAAASTSFRTNTSQLNEGERINGYAAEIGGAVNLPWEASLQASYVYSNGSNEYIYGVQGLDGYSYGVVDGEAEAIAADAWTVAYNQKLTATLSGNVFYSAVNIDNNSSDLALVDQNANVTSVNYAGANIMWAADKNMDFGVEYVVADNTRIDASHEEDAKAQRINLLAQYSF